MAPASSTPRLLVAGAAAPLLCALALALAPGTAAAAPRACEAGGASPASAARKTIASATLCLLNAERSARGLKPLLLEPRLSRAARAHARDMARRDYFAHDSLDGRSFLDRIRRTGYLNGVRNWSAGENIAWGSGRYATPSSIMSAWMGSPGHRANILSKSFSEIGVGLAYDAPEPGAGAPAATYATDFGSRG